MSHSSIFGSALNSALLRRPLSLPALRRLNSALAGNPTTSNPISTPDSRKRHRGPKNKWVPHRWDRDTPRRWERDTRAGARGQKNHPPPSDLLRLLHGLGVATTVRESVVGKTDLTHFDPLAPTWERKKQLRRKVIGRRWAGMNLKGIAESFIYHFYYGARKVPPKGSLPNVHQLHEDQLGAVFNPKTSAYLESRGYKPEDVMVWVWVLMAKDGVLAGLRLDMWAKVGAIKMEQELQERVEKRREAKLVQDWRKRIEEWKRREEEEEKDGSDRWGWNTAMDFLMPKKQDPETDALIVPTITQVTTVDLDTSPITASPTTASSSITSGANTPSPPTTPRIPPFLLLFILRLPYLPSTTLRVLLPYITATLVPIPFPSGDTKTPLVLLIRLLRHTRAVYPTALPHVATLITTHLHPDSHPPVPSPRLAATYNRLLSLFSLPTHDRPFKSLSLLQRSQFLLLRKMASLKLPITREGYRALTNVQLAHRKTESEIAVARSLATTWPPWPIVRDGHAASISVTIRPLSRAAQVLQQMVEAGYPWQGWEAEAAVLSGTDTDLSPTIQTRSFYHGRRATTAEDPCALWAVRVRATRTVEEAWSVFLAAREANELAPEVWEEMFAKLLAAAKGRLRRDAHRERLERIKAAWQEGDEVARWKVGKALQKWDLVQKLRVVREKQVFPGDGTEVRVAPVSPSDGIYIDLPVPGVEEMFAMMRRVGGGGGAGGRVRVRSKLITMLVKGAESVEAGEWVMKEWSKERWRRMVKGGT